MSRHFLILACCLPALVAGSAQAGIIGPGDFSPSVTLINFDSLSGGPTGSSNTDGDVITTQFAGLGVTFVNPNVDPTTSAPFKIYANNASFLDDPPGFGFGSLFTSPNAAFIDLGGGHFNFAPAELHFASPVDRVGLDFLISAQSTITMTLLDSGGGFLEATTVTNSGVLNLAGFIGLENLSGASKVLIDSQSTVLGKSFNFHIDNLRFDAADVSAVPEPSSLALLSIGGLIGAIRLRRRRTAATTVA